VKVPSGETVEWLEEQLRKALKVDEKTKITLKYFDADFAEYIPFDSLSDLPQKAKVKVFTGKL
jgi:hypothetical protein